MRVLVVDESAERAELPEFAQGEAEFGEELLVHHAVVIGRRRPVGAGRDGRQAFDGEVVRCYNGELAVPRPGDELLGLFHA